MKVSSLYPSTFTGKAGLALLVALTLFALAAPEIGFDYSAQNLPDRLTGPGWPYLMGADQLGRDQLSRIAEAVRGSLITAVVITAIAGFGGGALGALSGYFGGKTDLVAQRLVDAVMALPLIVVALAVVTAFGADYWSVTLAISVAFMPLSLRVVRSSVLSLREVEFIASSRVSGGSASRALFKHLAPNVAGPWSVVAASQAGAAVLVEAALGFLGLAPAGRLSIGGLLGGEAQLHMYSAPWLIIWPGIALVALSLAFNLVGEWLSEKSTRLPEG